jgi:hypothetical protein
MATAAGLFVVAGAVGAAIWALLGRGADETAQPDTVPASEEQVTT